MELLVTLVPTVMMLLLFVKVCQSHINMCFHCLISDDLFVQPVNCTTGEVRLFGGSNPNEGRLEVCINQVWGTVCSKYWHTADTKTACRELGYQELGKLKIYCCQYEYVIL